MSEADITPVELAIQKAGGVVETAKKLNLGQTTISQWKRRGRVSHAQARALAKISGVSVHSLRPDVFGELPARARASRTRHSVR